MHQTKKGNQWHFGMKAHIGVDSKNKIIHSVVATAANVADSQILPDLLTGMKPRSGATGLTKDRRTSSNMRAPSAGHDQPALPPQGRSQ